MLSGRSDPAIAWSPVSAITGEGFVDSSSRRPRHWVGQRLLRREDARLLQGRGSYVDDIQLLNTLHVGLVRSPLAHGTIDACVTERARRMPGVVGVFKIDDMLATVND